MGRMRDLACYVAARKLCLFFLFFLVTGSLLAVGDWRGRCVVLGAAAVLAVLVLGCGVRWRILYKVLLPILGGILLAGGSSLLLFDGYVGRYQAWAEAETVRQVRGVVKEVVWTTGWSGQYVLQVETDGVPYAVSVTSGNPSYGVGQVLAGEIRFQPWDPVQNDFDTQRYNLAKGVVSAAEDVSLADTGETKITLAGLFHRWNRHLSARISAHVRNDGLPLAMLLGNREALEDTIKRDFRRMGVLHLLAVSGTHFTMLASMAERFLISLRVRPKYRCGILFGATIVYMLLTGLSGSVRRAGLMFLVALLCRSLEMKVRYFTSLNVACGLICLADPFAVMDVGLQLSYLAVCGCILTIRLEDHWKGWQSLWRAKATDPAGKPSHLERKLRAATKGALSMLLLHLVVTGLTLPLTWLYFGELSTLSLAVNLFYIPATGGLLLLTLVYLLLYPLPFLRLPVAALLSGYAALLEIPAGWLAALPWGSLSLAYPFVPLFLLPLCLCVCALPFVKRKLAGLGAVLLCMTALSGTILVYDQATADQTHVVYRNDGLRDGFVIRSGGEVLVVDVSDGSGGFSGQLLSEAKGLYATELGGYLLTHYHNRHVGTFQSLTDNWILRRLYLPEPMSTEEEAVFRSLTEEAAAKDIPVTVFQTETDFGHMHITVAPRTWLSRSSHPVTGVVLAVGDTVLAYGSSSMAEGAAMIVDAFASADIGIQGAHSPVNKKAFTLAFTAQPDYFIWNGKAVLDYEGVRPVAGKELLHCTRFAYRFPDAAD